jgi:flagellar hook protein FlgE
MVATGSFRQNQDGYLITPGELALLGWPTSANGTLIGSVSRDSPSSLEPVRLSSFLTAADSTTDIELGVNLPAIETEAGATGLTIDSPIEYFDAIGRQHQLQISYTPVVPATGASNAWTISFTDSASPAPGLIAEFDLVFDGSRAGPGDLISATPAATNPADPNGPGTTASFDAVTGALTMHVLDGPLTVQIQSNAFGTGLSQLAAPFTPNGLSKNGAPAGNLQGLEIDSNGFVRALFDTGITRVVYQIPIVDLPNPNGLITLDEQMYLTSPDSGPFFLWDAGDGPTGEIAAFAREESNVDVAGELTAMIQTQRAYSSNAKVIQTVDEMLQETTNIKR